MAASVAPGAVIWMGSRQAVLEDKRISPAADLVAVEEALPVVLLEQKVGQENSVVWAEAEGADCRGMCM